MSSDVRNRGQLDRRNIPCTRRATEIAPRFRHGRISRHGKKNVYELWENGDLSAKELSQRLNSCVGWNKNTTYTVIKKCVDKGAIARLEPNFICHALISRREETQALLDRAFDGSAELLMASLLGQETLSPETLERLRRMIEEQDV